MYFHRDICIYFIRAYWVSSNISNLLLMPIKINLTVDKKIYINVFVSMERLLLFIFWLQLLVAQIVVVGDLVAAVVRAVALLVEQPARMHKDL